MIKYRITISKKPTLRLWKVEGNDRILLGKIANQKAALTEEIILRSLTSTIFMKYRDGRIIYNVDEDSAVRLLIALKGIAILRRMDKVTRLLEVIKDIGRGEVFWWYSLYLKLGSKAITALRKAYT